ncbi:hypothetical protein F383_06751 [Gossypium arboreum]|uniref:Uncharacterized protein n=1 Tax=Gossypium arboreum TaxID=29729 RepID=A0A0B0PK85_GOSAR|nr:hypothetical protein F383_06751 [Gossypium arboreum]
MLRSPFSILLTAGELDVDFGMIIGLLSTTFRSFTMCTEIL